MSLVMAVLMATFNFAGGDIRKQEKNSSRLRTSIYVAVQQGGRELLTTSGWIYIEVDTPSN